MGIDLCIRTGNWDGRGYTTARRLGGLRTDLGVTMIPASL
jgi:hypothetical protein